MTQNDDGQPNSSAVILPAEEIPNVSEKEGYCPTGDLGCPGLTTREDGKLHCGLEGNPNATYQVAACNGCRQEAR